MEIQVSQVIPGYILMVDVIGKTKHPIIKKDTVLTKEHILILERFLIKKVRISKASITDKSLNKIPTAKELTTVDKSLDDSFIKKYDFAVISYKKQFSQWQNNLPIDMPSIRRFLLPLIEYIDRLGIEVYQLYKHSTAKDYIYHHDISVAILSAFLAKELGYTKGEWIQIGLAGFLSNCGKAKLMTDIFMKADPLTPVAKEEMEKHPIYSFKLIESIPLIKEAVKISILQHHERLDGSGYPLGTVGGKIHPYAQIIAVCDTYCAMTSERLYERKQSPFKVINTLKKLRYSKFDPQIVQAFVKRFMNLSLGKRVKLSNSQVGTITSFDRVNSQYPLILLDSNQTILSLEDEQDLFISEFISKV